MRQRRTKAAAVLAGALALWLVAGTPAQAAAPSGGIETPTADAVLTTASPTITGSYSHPDGGEVDEVALIVQSAEGHGTWSKSFPGDGSSRLDFTYQMPALAYNGRYRAQAQAKGTDAVEIDGQESSPISVRDFSVAVPPAAPTGLRSSSSSSKQQVSLTWDANKEPDMLGYEVQRQAPDSSKWVAVAHTASTSAVDPVPEPGTWKYRIVAIRAGADSEEGVASEPSTTSAASVKPPPTTTTTSEPASGSSGSSTGGSSGGASSDDQTSGDAGGTPSGSTSGGSTSGSSTARAGRVDLSGYAALLDSNRRQLRTTPTTELDPGYNDTLPFQPLPEEEEVVSEPADEPSVEVGFTRTSVTDEGAQRRKMAYFAGSFLAFVLAMHGWFIRGEIRRQEELEALEATSTDADLGGPGPGAEVLVPSVVTATSARSRRRLRRAERRLASDGPEEGRPGATVSPDGEDKGGRGARRAARRVSPRPGDDRPEGGAAVRARRRGPVGSDRRPAV